MNVGKLGKAFVFLLTVMLLLTVTSRAAASFTVARVRVETPQARRIVHTVRGEGIVEKMGEQPVYAVADVLVAQIGVKAGQSVKKGDVLARLDIDSLDEKMGGLLDELEELRLMNEGIAAREKQSAQERSSAGSRAREDYEQTVADGEAKAQEARQRVKDAREKVEQAKEEAGKQADTAYGKRLGELQQAADAAKKEYDAAIEQEKEVLLAAKRALEDASKAPADDYGIELLEMEILQNQQQINRLYRKLWETPEDFLSIKEQIAALETEMKTLDLQLKEKKDTAANQAQARAQAITRAQEDYDNAAAAQAKLVSEAKAKWDEAELAVDAFFKSGRADVSEDASVKAAEDALADAKKQKEEETRQQEAMERQAKRALEDAAQGSVSDNTAKINELAMEEKRRQLELLTQAKKHDGAVTAQLDGIVTQVQLVVGQKTPETAAFLLSDTSGSMSFTTQIGKEDAVYVTAGDVVTMKSADQEYEDMEILSVETNEDESVQVTVYVPKDTFQIGAYVGMELTKQSQEYGTTVPVAALHTENEKYFVYVMEPEESVLGGKYAAMRMEVTVPEKNGLYAAVTESSLTAESQVILDCDRMISAGETVRLQEE